MMASQVQTMKMYILLISIFSILVQSVQSQDEADESMEEDNQNDSSVPDLLQDFPSTKQKESAFYANEQIFQLKPTIKGSEKFKANIFTLPNGFELILHEDALLSEPRKCLKAVTINLADYKSDAQRIIQAYADPFFWGAVICELYVIWNPVIIYNRKNEDTETNEEKEHYAVLSHKERVVELFNFFLKQNIPQLFLEGAWTDFIAPILEEASNDYSVSAIILYPSFDDSRHFKAVSSTDLFETYRSELLLRLWNLNQFRHIVAVEAGFLYAMISATLESQHGFWEPGWDTDVAHGWHEIKKKNPFYVWESEMDEKKSVSTQAASAGASSKNTVRTISRDAVKLNHGEMSNELIDTLIEEVDGAMVEAGSDDDQPVWEKEMTYYNAYAHHYHYPAWTLKMSNLEDAQYRDCWENDNLDKT